MMFANNEPGSKSYNTATKKARGALSLTKPTIW